MGLEEDDDIPCIVYAPESEYETDQATDLEFRKKYLRPRPVEELEPGEVEVEVEVEGEGRDESEGSGPVQRWGRRHRVYRDDAIEWGTEDEAMLQGGDSVSDVAAEW